MKFREPIFILSKTHSFYTFSTGLIMECKPKVSLTSWVPWKFLRKSKNLLYFTTHLRRFMHWLFLRLLSTWEINGIAFRLVEKKPRRTQKRDSKWRFLSPCCPPLVAGVFWKDFLSESLRRCAAFRLQRLPPSNISSSPAIYTCTQHLPTQHCRDSRTSRRSAKCFQKSHCLN